MVHVAFVRGRSSAYVRDIRPDKHSCLMLSNGNHELGKLIRENMCILSYNYESNYPNPASTPRG